MWRRRSAIDDSTACDRWTQVTFARLPQELRRTENHPVTSNRKPSPTIVLDVRVGTRERSGATCNVFEPTSMGDCVSELRSITNKLTTYAAAGKGPTCVV